MASGNGMVLSERLLAALRKSYRSGVGRDLWVCEASGVLHMEGGWDAPILVRARLDALQEAIRWGEPYMYYALPGVVSWIVPIMGGDTALGGLCDPGFFWRYGLDRETAERYLVGGGMVRAEARKLLEGLDAVEMAAVWELATQLFEELYDRAGLDRSLLVQNRENASQQRQIGEAIQEAKREGHRSGLEQERMLLALIRIGDRPGARGVLNEMLASIFLDSPRFPVVKARTIEMMGFLVRAAIEASPLQDVLMDRHHDWVVEIIETDTFEALCEVLRRTLDDFIDSVALQGFNRTSWPVARALRYVAENCTGHVSLTEAARVVGLSQYRLAHLLKETTGYSLMQHVKRIRVQRAMRMLEQGGSSIADVAHALGFSDQSHFTRHFREIVGVTPKRWLRGG